MEVAFLYTDGGLVGKSPSRVGGSWAYVKVGKHGGILTYSSGIITPGRLGVSEISSNTIELLAAVNGMETLPDGWDGLIVTDSSVTKLRLQFARKFKGVPEWLEASAKRHRRRLRYEVMLVAGHPTRRELEFGRDHKNGLPVSKHNVFADRLCSEAVDRFKTDNPRWHEKLL